MEKLMERVGSRRLASAILQEGCYLFPCSQFTTNKNHAYTATSMAVNGELNTENTGASHSFKPEGKIVLTMIVSLCICVEFPVLWLFAQTKEIMHNN